MYMLYFLRLTFFLRNCWNPVFPCQKQLCSQRLISVHISLHANELCSPRPSLLWKSKRNSTIIIKNTKLDLLLLEVQLDHKQWVLIHLWVFNKTCLELSLIQKAWFVQPDINKFSESEVNCGQVWWPILGICALNLAHPSARTHSPGAVGSHIAAAPEEQLGFGALLNGFTSVVVLKVEESAGIHSKIKMAW